MTEMTAKRVNLTSLALIVFFALGLFLRLYYINFGLPHVTFADEDKLGNFGIVLSYQWKEIIAQGEFNRLAPDSFVYGSFSIYLNALLIMFYKIYLKIRGLNIDFLGSYTYLRVLNALLAASIIPAGYLLAKKLFGSLLPAVISFFLLAFNWKIIVHSHYLNSDLTLTFLLTLSFLALYNYYTDTKPKLSLFFASILYGFCVGTKITSLISLPLFAWLIYSKAHSKKDLLTFMALSFGAFALSNPFSFIFFQSFVARITEMRLKENGIVFDSVNFSPFKYLEALAFIGTPLVLLAGVIGMVAAFKNRVNSRVSKFHLFLVLNFVAYFLFFTLSSRRVDRWVLPVLPIVLLYSSSFITSIILWTRSQKLVARYVVYSLLILIAVCYLYFPYKLLTQFQRNTPQTEAFSWIKANIRSGQPKLLVTDSSLDPIRSVKGVEVMKVNIYSSSGAQHSNPNDPAKYEYVFALSRPLERYNNATLQQLFPSYFRVWQGFHQELTNSGKYTLVKTFNSGEPNLIPLSSVYIFRNDQFVPIISPESVPQ